MRGLELMKLSNLFVTAPDLATARARTAELENQRRGPVKYRLRQEKAHLGWSGDVTAATIEAIWEHTAVMLDAYAGRDEMLSIDLEKVEFIDSAGLGFMVRVRRMARQHGVNVRFVNPSDSVQRLVRLAKLEEFLLDHAT
jgi:anti-anti-sigma factor